jgi:uncharacterized protein YceK
MAFPRLLLVVVSSSLFGGCGTLSNAVMIYYHERPSYAPDDYKPPNYVYGGVKADAYSVKAALVPDEEMHVAGAFVGILSLIDMPLSAVGDTLALPNTMAVTAREAEWWKKAQATRDWLNRTVEEPDVDPPAPDPSAAVPSDEPAVP